MKKKLLFVFNPKSGKGLIKEHLVNIVDIMTKAGYKITIYPTQCQGDAIKKVRKNAKKYDLVVCSGGDGTLDEVVTGMEQSEVNVPIGYIPAGSTNDFANSLGIPKNMEEAARVAVNGTPFPCGRLQRRYLRICRSLWPFYRGILPDLAADEKYTGTCSIYFRGCKAPDGYHLVQDEGEP